MQIAQAFSMEMLGQMLIQTEKKQADMLDLLQLLMMASDDTEKRDSDIADRLQRLTENVDEVKSVTDEINHKLDHVLEMLSKLETDFDELKKEYRDIEQKITIMSAKLTRLEQKVDVEDLDDYYALAQSLYESWEELDDLTRKFIPLAEYLFSKLQKYDKPDYSPVILELCRAIENEFLLKIFRKYTLDLIRRYNTQQKLDSFLCTDKAYLSKDTGVFVKAVTKAARTQKPEYTLGQMNMIMNQLSNTALRSQSPLLQDFNDYLRVHTEFHSLLDRSFIQSIDRIVNDYRNPSAHPEYMTIDKAKRCKEIMPGRLDYLMNCLRAH